MEVCLLYGLTNLPSVPRNLSITLRVHNFLNLFPRSAIDSKSNIMSTQDLRGTFWSSLKKRPLWRVMGPVIAASAPLLQGVPVAYPPGAYILEAFLTMKPIECSNLQGPDLVISLDPSSHLKILLLSESSLASFRQETITRIEDFSRDIATTNQRHAIAFLISEETFSRASGKYSLDGLMALQVLVLESLADPLPIIPIPESSCFVSCIHEYTSSLVDVLSVTRPPADTVSLLHSMRTPPSSSLSGQDANFLSDLFPSLNNLSQAVRTSEGRFLLREYLGQQAEVIIEFLKTDRVVEL